MYYYGAIVFHFAPPYLHEKLEPYDQTLFELRMVDLISSEILAELKDILKMDLNNLDSTKRLILATAKIEFAKYLILQYPNTETEVTTDELNEQLIEFQITRK